MRYLLLILALLIGCRDIWLGSFPDIPDLGLQTVPEVMDWVAENIRYVPETSGEYFQSPQQTYDLRTGDCEDFVILALYLSDRDAGERGEIIVGWVDETILHAWADVGGHEWDVWYPAIIDGNPHFREVYRISYDDAMRRSTTTHKSVRPAKEEKNGMAYRTGE